MSNIFFVSDTHWGHQNIIKYSNRPYKDTDEMNQKMLEAWNKTVQPGDTVYHLGDVAFMTISKLTSYMSRLNGQMHIILGNHDKVITENQSVLLNTGKVATIQHYREIKVSGQNIVLFHYGCRVWNRSHSGAILLYGHSHGSLPPFGKSVDVGVDCKEITSDYRPIHLDEVIAYMDKRVGEVVDHHGMREE